ncbi:MAG: alpha/beta fold hydrolase [Ignavibacteriales bacterium]|nr:alpha/beta fold hydrolase [Ignavibacteriales bacterium]
MGRSSRLRKIRKGRLFLFKCHSIDQIKIIDELKLKNVVYVGHSMGGQIGIKLARKYPTLLIN